jgi:hypothetical protein
MAANAMKATVADTVCRVAMKTMEDNSRDRDDRVVMDKWEDMVINRQTMDTGNRTGTGNRVVMDKWVDMDRWEATDKWAAKVDMDNRGNTDSAARE